MLMISGNSKANNVKTIISLEAIHIRKIAINTITISMATSLSDT